MILINLTGDFKLTEPTENVASHPELLHLNAFLGTLRGSRSSEDDPVMKAFSDIMTKIRRKRISSVALQVTSELSGNRLIHEFRIVEI